MQTRSLSSALQEPCRGRCAAAALGRSRSGAFRRHGRLQEAQPPPDNRSQPPDRLARPPQLGRALGNDKKLSLCPRKAVALPPLAEPGWSRAAIHPLRARLSADGRGVKKEKESKVPPLFPLLSAPFWPAAPWCPRLGISFPGRGFPALPAARQWR